MTRSLPQLSLYEQDFALWAEDTIAKLKAGKFDQLDVENLIEEIAALVSSNKRELENRLEVLLAHILKRRYINSPYDNRGWMATIREQRRQIKRLLRDSPSLKNYLIEQFDIIYQDALEEVQADYDADFPNEWRFSRDLDALLNDSFWEEQA